VLHANNNLHEGVGLPSWNLVCFLILAWAIIFLILFKGIRFSGKFSYVTGIVPFIFLFVFLVRAVTLPGAIDGIKYFFTPQWEDIFKPSVWFAACTQLFFSLNVFLANIIMYASYNKFDRQIQRDANIVTSLDTVTSILAGCITFGIVGHLSKELGTDIKDVFHGGPGLVFITYAETISKFVFLPQFFSIMFFLMVFILGVGSLIAMTSCVITVIKDQFKKVETWHAALVYAIFGVLIGSLYTTPVRLILI
jgi:solute carrier family 6 (neurotransmitter transporter, glycine) member 5/9